MDLAKCFQILYGFPVIFRYLDFQSPENLKRILIAEDELLVAKTYSLYLQRQGFEVIAIVSNADVAVEKSRELNPDIIVMDVHLRDNTNGFDAAGKIRKFSDAAIIFTTGSSIAEAEKQSEGIHNSFVLIKPVEPEQIEKVILKFL